MTRISLIALALSITACTASDEESMESMNSATTPVETTTDPMTTAEPGNLVDVATEAGDFNTLLAAVEAAGLTETLEDGGPFTVIAPTDAAFDGLPEGTVEALLEDIPALTDILLYHVVDGAVGSDVVVGESLVTTLNGIDFKVTVDGDVYLNDAMVTVTDIEASNGIIHVVDTVLIPPGSITDIAVSDPDNFSTLVAALTAADLATTLAGEGEFTVFAPTNAAFDALPAGVLDGLLADVPALTDILLYHVSGSKLPAADVLSQSTIMTLQGSSVEVSETDGQFSIDGAGFVITDIPAANGVIHVIDSVLIPN